MNIDDTITLYSGTAMPRLGLGTWRAADGEEVRNAVRWALEAGYRHIDTAAAYDNEAGVGEAIHDAGVPRSDLFVTTKLWNDAQRAGEEREAFNESLERLGMGYIDLYLIHWPIPGKFVQSWRVLEELFNEGRCKAIGVSNFLPHHLDELARETDLAPMVNQIELHPRLTASDIEPYCRAREIVVEAWSPVLRGQADAVPELAGIARAHGKTATQVAIRWHLQHGRVVIPKSVHRERIEENANVFDFELSEQEMRTIDGLDRDERMGPHPDHVNF
jgi:diketogulonate reductase-like aldo/keto reductase